MELDPRQAWYHGSPLELTVLRAGSTITQKRELARVFSHKPALVEIADDGQSRHNGSLPGFLYAIAEEVRPQDVVAHPRTTMEAGDEWLTTRELHLRLLCVTQVVASECLTDEDVAELMKRATEMG